MTQAVTKLGLARRISARSGVPLLKTQLAIETLLELLRDEIATSNQQEMYDLCMVRGPKNPQAVRANPNPIRYATLPYVDEELNPGYAKLLVRGRNQRAYHQRRPNRYSPELYLIRQRQAMMQPDDSRFKYHWLTQIEPSLVKRGLLRPAHETYDLSQYHPPQSVKVPKPQLKDVVYEDSGA